MSVYICISPNVNSYYFSAATNNGLNVIGNADLAHTTQPFQYGAGQPTTVYLAKAVMSDTVTLLFHTQWNGSSTYLPLLYICDVHQNTIGTINLNTAPVLKGYQNIPGNVYTEPFTGATTQLLASMWSFSWSDFSGSLTPGSIYYIRIDNPDASNVISSYYSEPIFLAASSLNYWGYEMGQQNTLYFSAQYAANRMQNTNVIISNWWNDYSTDSVPYQPVFNVRCEGMLLNTDMQMINIGYLQQNYEALFITGQQVPKRILKIGELSQGIPDYMLQIISEFLIADRVFINNTGNSNLNIAAAQWYKLAGGNNSTSPADMWKTKRDDCTPLLYATVPLMLGSNSQQAMVTPYLVPSFRVIDYTGDSTGA